MSIIIFAWLTLILVFIALGMYSMGTVFMVVLFWKVKSSERIYPALGAVICFCISFLLSGFFLEVISVIRGM